MDLDDASVSRTFLYGTLLAVAVLLIVAGAFWLLQVREEPPVPARIEEDDSAAQARIEEDDSAAQARIEEDVPAAQRAAADERVRVSSPRPNDVVSSPLTVRGEAPGPWYFEADFPVRLLDGDGSELAVAPAQARGEWMTDDFVPFDVVLDFQEPGTQTGFLTLDRSNPSGLSQDAAQVVIPVRFTESAPRTTAVRAYFNSSAFGQGECEAVWPVPRAVESTPADPAAILSELLEGPTRAERERGFLTNIPEGVRIQSVRVEGGTAYADFDSRLNQAAGSCRVMAIRAQIERTLLQLPTVEAVVISVDGDAETALQP